MQGKSSLLDAMTAAFGGKKNVPTDPVRHGADSALIHIELDGGALTVTRRMAPDGSGSIEVTQTGHKIRSPQEMLDRLVSGRFLDPHAFTMLPAKEQRAQLLTIIDREGALAKIDERRARLFDKRTEVGRDLKRAEGELSRHKVVEVPAPIDVAALAAERAAISEQQRQAEHCNTAMQTATAKTMAAQRAADLDRTRLRQLEDEVAALRDALVGHDANVKALAEAEAADAAKAAEAIAEWTKPEAVARRTQLDADLARADSHNREVFAAEAGNKRRVEAADAVAKLEAQRTEQTKMIDKIDEQKLAFLTAAKLPVEGLGVDADGMTLNGVPFAQASGAEKLRVALAIAIAASPNLDDVWIRDGALMDDESLALVEEHAAAAGKRCWVEIISDSDPSAIVIQDGVVRE